MTGDHHNGSDRIRLKRSGAGLIVDIGLTWSIIITYKCYSRVFRDSGGITENRTASVPSHFGMFNNGRLDTFIRCGK